MRREPHNNINRVQAWVNRKQPGEKFKANTIGKELNLSTGTVSSVLKWQDNIEQIRDPGRTSEWVRV